MKAFLADWRLGVQLMFVQMLSYALLCWNYRAVAKGIIPQVVLSDVIFAALSFKVFKKMVGANTDIAWIGYVAGGAIGSAISVGMTKYIWGS